jgi:hypothetical protein
METKTQAEPAVSGQDDLYREAAESYGGAIARLVRAYEFDADKRKDLQQEIRLPCGGALRVTNRAVP